MAKSAESIAQKWATNLGASTQSIRDGVAAVSESPTEKAAARQDAWLAGVQRAHSNGKFADRLRSVTLDEWKRAMVEKALPRIGAGATAAQPIFRNFMSQFMPHVQQGVESLPARGDMNQNIQRAVEMIRHNAGFKFNR